MNQYTSLSGTTSKNFVYDDNGNLKSDGTKAFTYDYKNRLVKVANLNGTGIIAEFAYDVLGRRYEKKTNLETTKYVYSNENILSEYKTSNGITTKKEYINGLGTDNLIAVEQEESDLTTEERGELNFCNTRVLPYENEFNAYSWTGITERCNELSESGTILTTNRYYFSKNHLGNVDGITDNSGNIVTSYEYDSYGNFSLSGSDIGNTRLFTSREYDEEIGLYYFRARYYSSELGRFVSRDPIGQVDDVNLYGYTKNNPVMFVDLMGLAKTFLKVVDIFNDYGNKFDSLNNSKLKLKNYIGVSSDYDVGINTVFGYITELGDANIKVNEELRKGADWIDPTYCNEGLECGKTIVIEGKQIWLSDLGNLLYGFNGARAGFSYEHIENSASLVTDIAIIEGVNKTSDNELNDRPFYKVGYELGKNTNGNISAIQLLESIKSVYGSSNYFQQSRKGW